MTAWLPTLIPTATGGLVWLASRRTRSRAVLGIAAVGGLLAALALSLVAAAADSQGTYGLGGGLQLTVGLDGVAGPIAVLVAAIGATVVAYAAAHEPDGARDGLGRLLALMTVFVGAMLLLVTTTDLLGLTVAFELVGGLSWALISHDWRAAEHPSAAAHAFNATRAGGLGLFLAAGAAVAGTGSLAYADLAGLTGANLHVVVAGVLLAAAAKSAQGPFAPWLFSAMAGPTSVSALLHSSTMVAAGAYVLIRLHPVLDHVTWFAPATIGLGLVTALAGGVVALLQAHVKKLLAASTSAQYGLMLIAVGAGFPEVAAIHLVVHAVFKALLFMAGGVAMTAAGSPLLGRMRLGRALPLVAGLAAVGALALAAVPPLGGGWSKEAVTAAAGHQAPWLALAVISAGGLSAAYATRWWLLAFGPLRGDPPAPRPPLVGPGRVDQAAMAILAAGSVVLGVLWSPAVHEAAARLLGGPPTGGAIPPSKPWEQALSLLVLVVAAYAVWSQDRLQRLGHVGTSGRTAGMADWLGLPLLTRRLVVQPALATAAALVAVDDRWVDHLVDRTADTARGIAGVLSGAVEPAVDRIVNRIGGAGPLTADAGRRWAERGIDAVVADVAVLLDRAGGDVRRSHTGMIHHQFVVIAAGIGIALLAAVFGR